MQKRLKSAMSYVNHPESFWNSVLVSDECKFSVFADGPTKVYRKPGEALKLRNTVPTVKHGSGFPVVWGCAGSKGVAIMEVVEGKMDQYMYQGILSSNVKQSAVKLGMGRRFIFQQDHDPKHTAASTTEFFKKKHN